MYPTNKYMDPYYSHFRDHCPYPYYPPPSFPAGNHRMTMDSSCPPPSYGPWPYTGSASHSSLPESHSCCNHTYPPGYYSFRPPFTEELPPPHPYYHGQFPHQPNAYPSYFVPPPPYAVDQTPYGYGKFKSHCCGCPNHVCHGEGKSNLKIEEEMPELKPETEQKGPYNSSIIRHPNYQYPVMWLPSGNMNDKFNGRSSELPPQLFSKWFPESGEKTDVKQEDHDNQKAKQFQWPIIWMPPGYNEPKQEANELKEISESPKVTEEAPPSPKIKIIPLSWFENGDQDKKPAAKDGFGDHNERPAAMSQPASTEHRDGMMMDGNFKSIPVVPKKPNDENDPVGRSCEAISVVPDKEGDEKKVRTCRTIPVMAQKEEKAATEGEGSSVHYIQPLHDSSLSEDSSVLKHHTVENCHTEGPNDGVSTAATEDSTTAAATASMQSEMAVDNDGSVERPVQEYASVDGSQLKHDVAPAKEDQCNESSTPFVHLGDSSLYLKDPESHGNDPGHADDSIAINQGDQPEEPWVAKMQKQVADPMIFSTNEQDGTPEPTVGDTSVSVENSTQEQIISVEEASKQYEDRSASVDQPNEHHTEKTTGDSDIGEELEAVPFFSKTETVENTLNFAESPSNMCAEPILPEGESSELPCEFDGPEVHEYPDSKVSLVQKQQSDGEASASGIVECNEMPKGAPVCAAVVNSAVLETDDPKEHPVCATGVNSAVLGTDDLKEDAGGPAISEDVATVSTTHDGLKNNDEKKLIVENQMLKDMLQKLLASGSDHMGAMAELTEKIKVLEQKLARKKRPKVRVHRPSRNSAANVH